jgi:hypothetical protein
MLNCRKIDSIKVCSHLRHGGGIEAGKSRLDINRSVGRFVAELIVVSKIFCLAAHSQGFGRRGGRIT